MPRAVVLLHGAFSHGGHFRDWVAGLLAQKLAEEGHGASLVLLPASMEFGGTT